MQNNFGIHSKSTIHSVNATSSKYPGKERNIAVKFEDPSHEKTERRHRCARSKAWNLCQKHIQAQRERQSYIPLARGRMGAPGCVREFVVDSGASIEMVSKRDLNSAELETMRTSRNPTTVMTANGKVQTREEATVYVKELDLFVTVMLLEETHRSYFAREALRESWVYLPLVWRSKTTSNQKGQENLLHDLKLCTIRSPWFNDEFLYKAHTYFFFIIATLATRAQIAEFKEELSKHLLVKHIATLGPTAQLLDSCEVRFLNRVVRWIVPPFRKAPERIEIESDPRHAELLIKNSGLQSNSKGVNTPGARPRDSLRTIKLSLRDSTSYRSNVMRLAYLSADRIELQFASKELTRAMAEPATADVEALHSFSVEVSTMHPDL